jgi:CRISPR-associated endonuclease Cas3-HD
VKYFAHSPKDGVLAQPYEVHVREVTKSARQYAQSVAKFAKFDGTLLIRMAQISALYHDLGKLVDENQIVLSGRRKAKNLPKNHVDAGAAHFLGEQSFNSVAAAVIYAHHIGFPDFSAECNRQEFIFRDAELAKETDRLLAGYEKIHEALLGSTVADNAEMPKGSPSVFLRMLLSCLVDADHTDTAINYGKYPKKEKDISLRPAERLKALDRYIAGFSAKDGERSALRGEMYVACRDSDITSAISSCDSPVGSGKTTAVMAHLLAQAQKRELRRIIIVLPFTNIIEQSVEVYRKTLVLPGENSSDVVAELHHRADFESEDTRYLTALWRAPIIVTTAVAFFETLASNSTPTLRRLHELPGSAIFVDESHAALPAKLLPLAWRWMNIYADEWGCYWVLASGSLCRFWQIPEIAQDKSVQNVPEIVNVNLRERLSVYENNRLRYCSDLTPRDADALAEWVGEFPAPRLVIVNTVQSAAVCADKFVARYGRENVEHLSTALTPLDRGKTLARVSERLKDPGDTEWILIATSCVETGVDMSFQTGFRELGSLASLLQASGRINREGLLGDSQMWTFTLAEDGVLKKNPAIENAASVLRGYLFKNLAITPKLSTQAISDEICLEGISSVYKNLLDHERLKDFRSVEDNFTVIDSDTRIVVVDKDFAERIRQNKIDWRELQRNSVQIPQYKLHEIGISEEIVGGIYRWTLPYDDFIGYMAGIVRPWLV